jgi:phage-related protein
MREPPKEDSPPESIGPSREGLSEFRFQTKSEIGFALAGGSGEKADWAKSPKGCGDAGVLQIPLITSDFDGDTYRTVDTVKLKATIYVLHALQKKSNQENKASPGDISLIKARLKTAIGLHAESEDEVNKEHKKQR